jgi:hypothetical protein
MRTVGQNNLAPLRDGIRQRGRAGISLVVAEASYHCRLVRAWDIQIPREVW